MRFFIVVIGEDLYHEVALADLDLRNIKLCAVMLVSKSIPLRPEGAILKRVGGI